MQKNYLILGIFPILFSLYLISCSKSDDRLQTPGNGTDSLPGAVIPPAPLLDSFVELNAETPYNWVFTYNPDSTMFSMKMDGNYGYFYRYNSEKKLVNAYYVNPMNIQDTAGSAISAYSYDSKGNLSTAWYEGAKDSLIYNADNQLIRIFSIAENEVFVTDTLTWNGKNLTSWKRTNMLYDKDYVHELVFKYDNHKSGYVSARVWALTYFDYSHSLSENNVIEVLSINDGILSSTKKIAYSYNDKGYPVSATYTYVEGQITQQGSYRFVYKK